MTDAGTGVPCEPSVCDVPDVLNSETRGWVDAAPAPRVLCALD